MRPISDLFNVVLKRGLQVHLQFFDTREEAINWLQSQHTIEFSV
jgi:hypothetical protein